MTDTNVSASQMQVHVVSKGGEEAMIMQSNTSRIDARECTPILQNQKKMIINQQSMKTLIGKRSPLPIITHEASSDTSNRFTKCKLG